MTGGMPAVPPVHLATVDIRDVAEAELKAILTPAAAG